MPDPNFVILYVENTLASADFYTALLDRPPVEKSPTFAMFALDAGVMLGLWTRGGVEPAVAAPGCGGELAFSLADDEAVRMLHREWERQGLAMAQAPTRMDFGYTFVALDPDGHRLRVFAPPAP